MHRLALARRSSIVLFAGVVPFTAAVSSSAAAAEMCSDRKDGGGWRGLDASPGKLVCVLYDQTLPHQEFGNMSAWSCWDLGACALLLGSVPSLNSALLIHSVSLNTRKPPGPALRDTPRRTFSRIFYQRQAFVQRRAVSRPCRARPAFFQTPGAVVHPHEPQHPCVSTGTPPRTQDRKFKHLKTWLVTQNRASPPSRPSASGAAARGSPNVRRAGEAWQASEPRRPAQTISGHRDSLQLCSEFRGMMHPVIQKRLQASGSLSRPSRFAKKCQAGQKRCPARRASDGRRRLEKRH